MKKKTFSKEDGTLKLSKQLEDIFQMALAQENLTLALKATELQMKLHDLTLKNAPPTLPSKRLNINEWSDEEIEEALKSL